MGFNTGSGADWFMSNAPFESDKWSFITYVYKNNTINIYINGNLAGSHTFSQAHNTGSEKAFIGKSIHTGYENYIRATLDDQPFQGVLQIPRK